MSNLQLPPSVPTPTSASATIPAAAPVVPAILRPVPVISVLLLPRAAPTPTPVAFPVTPSVPPVAILVPAAAAAMARPVVMLSTTVIIPTPASISTPIIGPPATIPSAPVCPITACWSLLLLPAVGRAVASAAWWWARGTKGHCCLAALLPLLCRAPAPAAASAPVPAAASAAVTVLHKGDRHPQIAGQGMSTVLRCNCWDAIVPEKTMTWLRACLVTS
jgi:hypothetical protein